MKNKTLLALCVCLSYASTVFAQTPSSQPQITVFGTAELKVALDEAVFRLEIKEKATAMAAEIGQSIGKAIFINEVGETRLGAQAMANMTTTVAGALSESESLFTPGLIGVKANLIVSFELK